MNQLTLNISGMSCGHCVGRVKNALKRLLGVEVGKVEIGSATLSYDPALTSPVKIAAAVTDAGYDAEPAGPRTGTG
jgi:copper chaperone